MPPICTRSLAATTYWQAKMASVPSPLVSVFGDLEAWTIQMLFLHKPTFTPIGFQMAKIQHFFYSEVFFWCQKDKVRKIIFLLIGIQQKSISKTIVCLGVAQSLVVIFNSQAIEHFSILVFYSIVHFVRRKRVLGKAYNTIQNTILWTTLCQLLQRMAQLSPTYQHTLASTRQNKHI